MKDVLKSQINISIEAGAQPEPPALKEIHFGLGVLAAKHLSSEFGPAAPLVSHLLDQEFAKSELRTKNGILQMEYDVQSRTNFSLALENERLIDISNKDPLTGLFNRRGAEDAYNRLVDHAKRDNDRRNQLGFEPAGSQILIIDIDDFKRTNDTYGHGVGDEVLTQIASIMTSNTRQNYVIPDVISRIGGDEFLILMYGAPRVIANDTANAIRDEVRDFGRLSESLKTSVSIGVGTVNLEMTLKETVDRADQALLRAKNNGKNVVVHFDDISGPA